MKLSCVHQAMPRLPAVVRISEKLNCKNLSFFLFPAGRAISKHMGCPLVNARNKQAMWHDFESIPHTSATMPHPPDPCPLGDEIGVTLLEKAVFVFPLIPFFLKRRLLLKISFHKGPPGRSHPHLVRSLPPARITWHVSAELKPAGVSDARSIIWGISLDGEKSGSTAEA